MLSSRFVVFGALALSFAVPGSSAAQSALPTLPPLKVVDPAFIDTAANACTDFFQYANGRWYDHDTIPAAYSSSGVGRDMADRNELVVRSVLEDAMARRSALPAGSTLKKLGTFYATCMDSTAAEQAGVNPIRPWLAAIDSVTTKARLVHAIGTLQVNGANAAFYFRPSVDQHDAAHYIADFNQGGLGLPDRDYYLKADPASDSTRQAYVAHVTTLFTLAGTPAARAATDAQNVLALETALAGASLTRVERRDPAATDHPMPLGDFQSFTPAITWTAYFKTIGLTVPVTKVNVGEPAFFTRLNRLVDSVPLPVWRAYLRYHAISNAASWLSAPFVEENFAFSARFSGAKELLPRWKRCGGITDGELGEALGEAYVAKTFPPEARARAKAVIDDIRTAFGQRLMHLAWMSDTTRARALDKLAKMGEKVGYPDRWRDYSKLQAEDGPFVLNIARADRFEWERVINRPGQAVDKAEWDITVPTVNAYYDPTKNEMVFPAGALVPQTFDPKADDGANYGSLGGSWAGHELTHGFDDEGRHFDADGNLSDWWAPSDSVKFSEEAEKIVQQFNAYVQVDTFHVNGKLTEGENIADYGGVLTGFDALQRALERDGRPGLIDGYTPEQRFFLGYAQSWRIHNRDARLRSRVVTDPHAPEHWRVNGPLSNDPEFAKAFGCKAGDPMVRAPGVVPSIW